MKIERQPIDAMKKMVSRVPNETKFIVLGEKETIVSASKNNGMATLLQEKRNSQRS